jgi:hypothetical protein
MQLGVQLALITNGDRRRLDYLAPRLQQLQQVLSTRFDTAFISVRFQPNTKPLRSPAWLLKNLLYETAMLDWRAYRGEQVSKLKKSYRTANVMLRHLFSHANGRRETSIIEVAVTAKHIRAFDSFLESRRDFLICIEDDALIEDGRAEKCLELLTKLSVEPSCSDSNLYVDLAGGVPFSQLAVEKLEDGIQFECRKFRQPVTNTACAYLCNRPLVSLWGEILLGHPHYRLLPIDWMINKFFLTMRDRGLTSVCLHAEPPLFGHGSFEGRYEPWRGTVAAVEH